MAPDIRARLQLGAATSPGRLHVHCSSLALCYTPQQLCGITAKSSTAGQRTAARRRGYWAGGLAPSKIN